MIWLKEPQRIDSMQPNSALSPKDLLDGLSVNLHGSNMTLWSFGEGDFVQPFFEVVTVLSFISWAKSLIAAHSRTLRPSWVSPVVLVCVGFGKPTGKPFHSGARSKQSIVTHLCFARRSVRRVPDATDQPAGPLLPARLGTLLPLCGRGGVIHRASEARLATICRATICRATICRAIIMKYGFNYLETLIYAMSTKASTPCWNLK